MKLTQLSFHQMKINKQITHHGVTFENSLVSQSAVNIHLIQWSFCMYLLREKLFHHNITLKFQVHNL